MYIDQLFNPFPVTSLFLYPLETSKNQKFSDVFRGYRKRPVAWKGLRMYLNKSLDTCSNDLTLVFKQILFFIQLAFH